MSSITKVGKALRTVVSLVGYTKNAFVSLVFEWMVKAGLCAPKSIATKSVGLSGKMTVFSWAIWWQRELT